MSETLYSLNAEMGVLGSMILVNPTHPKVLDALSAGLKAEHFFVESHRIIFEALMELSAWDPLTLESKLSQSGELARIGGTDYLFEVAEYVPTVEHVGDYARIVIECAERRRLLAAAQTLARRCLSTDEDHNLESLQLYARLCFEQSEVFNAPVQSVHEIQLASDVSEQGVPSYFECINERLAIRGYPRGQITVVIGGEKGGKTSFMLREALHAAMSGRNVVFATFADLNAEAIKRRWLKSLTGWYSVPNGGRDLSMVLDALDTINACGDRLRVYDARQLDSGHDIETFSAWFRAEHAKKPVDDLYLDYAQELSTTEKCKDMHDEQVKIASKVTRLVAKAGTTAGFVGSQSSTGADGRTTARYAKAWQAKAGLVVTLKRDTEDWERVDVKLQESRFGPSGETLPIGWKKENATFYEMGLPVQVGLTEAML